LGRPSFPRSHASGNYRLATLQDLNVLNDDNLNGAPHKQRVNALLRPRPSRIFRCCFKPVGRHYCLPLLLGAARRFHDEDRGLADSLSLLWLLEKMPPHGSYSRRFQPSRTFLSWVCRDNLLIKKTRALSTPAKPPVDKPDAANDEAKRSNEHGYASNERIVGQLSHQPAADP
jgi:hypothetical protein